MFNNSKYGNVLTVILIITIVAILGIVGIIGYRIYQSRHIEAGATEAASVFENMVEQNANVDQSNNEIPSSTEISGLEETFSNNNSGSTKKTTTYKGFNVAGTIHVPVLNLKYPILEQNTKKSLETSVVLMYTANGLNEVGNSVIIGHNYRNGTMFSNVKKLTNGDSIFILDTEGRKVEYKVYNIYRTSGNDSSYITRNTEGKREISLSTCTDDSKARTIVLAKEV